MLLAKIIEVMLQVPPALNALDLPRFVDYPLPRNYSFLAGLDELLPNFVGRTFRHVSNKLLDEQPIASGAYRSRVDFFKDLHRRIDEGQGVSSLAPHDGVPPSKSGLESICFRAAIRSLRFW